MPCPPRSEINFLSEKDRRPPRPDEPNNSILRPSSSSEASERSEKMTIQKLIVVLLQWTFDVTTLSWARIKAEQLFGKGTVFLPFSHTMTVSVLQVEGHLSSKYHNS